jgi:ABC-type dipeptide/oligopeptide/nickel transport system permease component
MNRFVLQRLLWLPLLLLIVTFITFTLGFYGPGDPVIQRLGLRANPDAVERLRAELGLDLPFGEQFTRYVVRAAQGDLGESFPLFPNTPVAELIATKLSISIQLNLAALLVGAAVGIPLGIFAALYRNSILDYILTSGAVAGISLPTFALAPVLMWIFVAKFRLFGLGWDGILSTKAILPVFVLALGPLAVFMRQTRANLSETLGEDYIRTARGKGLSERVVIGVHAFRNALIPLVTVAGLMFGGLIGGSFIIEELFGIPGIGQLGVQAFYARDYPIIMALTLLVATVYALTNLLVDFLYAVVDPRIRVR